MGEKRNAGRESRSDAVRVVYCIQGGGRTSMGSQGLGVNEDVSFTVNAVDVHAVCYGIDHAITIAGGNCTAGGRVYIRKNRQH